MFLTRLADKSRGFGERVMMEWSILIGAVAAVAGMVTYLAVVANDLEEVQAYLRRLEVRERNADRRRKGEAPSVAKAA